MATCMVESSRKFTCLLLIQFYFYIDVVHGYYCEWNLCEVDQYCCGDNQCCNNVYSLWYFWAGIVFLVLMLLSFGGFFQYCYAYRPQIVVHQITNFMPLPSDQTCPEEMQGLVAYEDFESPQSYPADIKASKSPTLMLCNVNFSNEIPVIKST